MELRVVAAHFINKSRCFAGSSFLKISDDEQRNEAPGMHNERDVHGDLLDLLKREGGGLADATGNNVRMDALLDELLALAKDL